MKKETRISLKSRFVGLDFCCGSLFILCRYWFLKSLISNVQNLNFVHCSSTQTIGQAYEEMQTQNSRLLHQITERDDYNTQVLGYPLFIIRVIC